MSKTNSDSIGRNGYIDSFCQSKMLTSYKINIIRRYSFLLSKEVKTSEVYLQLQVSVHFEAPGPVRAFVLISLPCMLLNEILVFFNIWQTLTAWLLPVQSGYFKSELIFQIHMGVTWMCQLRNDF